MPVLTAPFVAMPVGVTVAKGFGGVDVDLDGAVLDGDGARIAGLYAAGELTGMAGGTLVGERGFTGSLTAVLLGGRTAGAAAAREALAAR
jgi:predicted oxidoreductase